jgi:hypothetical protein
MGIVKADYFLDIWAEMSNILVGLYQCSKNK